MTALLDLLARAATRIPGVTIALLLAATIGFGTLAAQLEVDTGIDGFAPEGGMADVLDEIGDRFGAAGSVQALIDAGPGGNVLDRATLAAVDRLSDAIADDPVVAAALEEERAGRPAVITFAFPFAMATDAADETLDTIEPALLGVLIDTMLEDSYDDIAPLLSADLDVEQARARSGLVQVGFAAEVTSEQRREAAVRVGEIVAAFDHPGVRTGVVSMAAIEDAIEASLERDMPVLLGTSLLLVLLVLAWLFRSVADVAVGFAGLLASIVWMAGFGALLGPKYLGVIGDFTQIDIAVPVLLVGLGIDYSVHLTTRYREQRVKGDEARRASRVALTTVGFALVLATIASVAGFLANIATPLPPIREFGILAAVGIVCAFVVLGGAVPATRTFIDRRKDRRRGAPQPSSALVRTDTADPAWVRASVAVATRHAGATLAVTVMLLGLGAIAASGLSTEFDERDFLPTGEPVIATLDRLDAQFGGDVGERTYVLVDGDPNEPELLAAAAAFEDGLVGLDDVRRVGTRADVASPFFVVDMLTSQAESIRERVADEIAAWHDPESAAADLRLPDPIDESLVDDADDLDLPDDLEEVLTRRLAPGRTTVGAMLATMDPDEIEEEIRAAIAESYREDRPTDLDDGTLARLASYDAHELNLDILAEGYPLDELDDDDVELLALLDRLEVAGWTGERPTSGATWQALLSVMRDERAADLAGVLDDDGLLINIATAAGADDAQRLAGMLEDRAGPLRDHAATVAVASDLLMQVEIIDALSAAQLQAIAISLLAAAILLVAASLFTSRSVGLGLIGIVPSLVALVFVLGSMRLVGIPFNALTATVASIAVGIGVPYGIHLINRFREARTNGLDPDMAIADTMRNTGPALVGSAVTTGLAFGVLSLSVSTPVVQFGRVSFMMIGYALIACVFVQPALLVLWARRRAAIGR